MPPPSPSKSSVDFIGLLNLFKPAAPALPIPPIAGITPVASAAAIPADNGSSTVTGFNLKPSGTTEGFTIPLTYSLILLNLGLALSV